MADTVRRCADCPADITSLHLNRKYCAPCQRERRRHPRSGVTLEQGARIRQLLGTMYRHEIAAAVGVSQTQLNRYLREHGLHSNFRDYPPDVVHAVCTAYSALGKGKTQELFPDVVVRCVIERYYKRHDYAPRQLRWTGEQLIDAARMAGLVSANAQARYFHRPLAYEGSIKKLWIRWFQCAPTAVHGLPLYTAWQIVLPGVVGTLVHQQVMPGPRVIVLWLDLVGRLKTDIAPWIGDAIATLARFQAWLFDTTDSDVIRAMITEREHHYAYHNRHARQRDEQDDVADPETRDGVTANF